MKKLLIGIFTFLIGFISFSSAGRIDLKMFVEESLSIPINGVDIGTVDVVVTRMDCPEFSEIYFNFRYISEGGELASLLVEEPGSYSIDYPTEAIFQSNYFEVNTFCYFEGYIENPYFSGDTSENTGSIPEILVYYNNGSSTSIACDGENSIAINGLSTLYGTSTFVPFFNISYVDENNQKLIESYDKEILYLDPGQFKKTFTGNNDWILSIQNQGGSSSDIVFTGETLPVVLTGSTGSVFSNFGDNALLLITSNIPGIIAGIFILGAIIFLFKLLTPNRRR